MLNQPLRERDYAHDVCYKGMVANNGTKSLAFGDITIITKGTNGEIIDISRSYIDGDTVYLSTIDSNTDTGLHVGNWGTFEIRTDADFDQYGEHTIRASWEEWADNSTSAYQPRNKRLRPTIAELQRAYIDSEGL